MVSRLVDGLPAAIDYFARDREMLIQFALSVDYSLRIS